MVLVGIRDAVAVEVGGGGRRHGIGVGTVHEAVAVGIAGGGVRAEGNLGAVRESVEIRVGQIGVGAVDEQLINKRKPVAVAVRASGVRFGKRIEGNAEWKMKDGK